MGEGEQTAAAELRRLGLEAVLVLLDICHGLPLSEVTFMLGEILPECEELEEQFELPEIGPT